MRKGICVPTIALCLLLTACGGTGEEPSANLRDLYHDMTGCTMEATVTCDQEGLEWEAVLRCDYVPDGKTVIEVLAPETIAGVKAVVSGSDWQLEYEGERLNVGAISQEEISPALCLPRLMDALRDGWLLEENEESWNDIPCLRLCVDQSGLQDVKIVSTVWLRQEDGAPLRGEIAVDGEIILTAEFTSFAFYDTIKPQEN